MRPTGRLHLGNYWGALRNWVDLSADADCFFMVADWHMLTTGYEDTGALQENVREMVLDWLAAGVDPQRCVVFKQSDVPEHAELALLLGMVTPLSWLENNPTWKEQLQELARTKESLLREQMEAVAAGRPGAKKEAAAAKPAETAASSSELRTFGFLGYPVLQAADILLYGGTAVPVGQDQLPHVELSREIARRFNGLFGPVLVEPRPVLTPTPRAPGVDGRKMSKSYGNAVALYETPESLKKKAMAMYTDPLKIRANDPGHPLPCPENQPGCAVFAFHRLYASREFADRREAECRQGAIGCVACKKDLLSELEGPFAAFAQRRRELEKDAGLVDQVLAAGAARARPVAQGTIERVRKAMGLK